MTTCKLDLLPSRAKEAQASLKASLPCNSHAMESSEEAIKPKDQGIHSLARPGPGQPRRASLHIKLSVENARNQ